jgi:hypothetical protein
MEKFYVTIEEHYVQTFEVKAEDMEEAMEIAEHRYQNGEFEVVSDEPQATLMMAEDESREESTEWVEF